MFGTGWDVVGLARFIGRRLTVDGQVEPAAHDYAPLRAVGVRRHLEPLRALEKHRLSVGAGDHSPLQTIEGRVYLREVLDPQRIRVQSGSLPCERRVCAVGHGVIILTAPIVSGGEMERLRGKRAIVTGAGSGIGRAIALRFAGEGSRVVISDVDGEAAASVASEAGGEANGESVVRRTDVTDSSEVEALVGTAVESGGGSVINLSSVAALVGIADRAVYSAAKGAILAITRAAAIDHVEEGVRVNCIAPGTVDTPWIGRITAGYDDPEEARRNMKARQPHGRLVAPEEIAAMAAYLASDESASVIGACMIVDGGVTAR